ncbi:reticulon-3-A [Astyanax mexicanus]|uniref:reticulon-3-A n=1 Tax=Astyanax mexicanus TaxID=7994 RepID=UPI0020CAFB4E|nr:reticulon-3-A [Astyanax mexicanus]
MEEPNSTGQPAELNSSNTLHNSARSVVEELVYWRDMKRSALVFGGSLLVLVSLATFSLISVVSYLLLALLCVTITFRVYKSVFQAIQKSDEGHPFKFLLDRDISITPETAHRYTDVLLLNLNRALIHTRRLLLVDDVVDSLKLAGLMWILTYVGAVFNGVTLLILADITFFCAPLVYEKNKTQIDRYVELVKTQLEEKLEKLQEKLPGAVQRSKTD